MKDAISVLRLADHSCTFLGIGPVSELAVRATFEASRRYSCPPTFIASRNQVELASLGHGYLMGGMDQQSFVDLLRREQAAVGYEGPVYICRDHGGPWQRNVELDEKYPLEKAMEIARQSFRADIEAGFNYLHIDPTKCPLPFTQDDLCQWTVDLVAFCEEVRISLGLEPIDYEVGTEDIKGGLTTTATYGAFLGKLTAMLTERKLPQPTCVVGQTGTLTRVDCNVGRFDLHTVKELVTIAAKFGVGLKEHNGDYLSAPTCRVHPNLGVAGMNVAPEFGLVETDALLSLADLEAKLGREGWLPDSKLSHLRELITERSFAIAPWKKWMTDEVRRLPSEQVESDVALRLLIARVCGHYTYDDPAVKDARQTLYANLNLFAMAEDAERVVLEKVRASIEFYLTHFRLSGVNALLRAHDTSAGE